MAYDIAQQCFGAYQNGMQELMARRATRQMRRVYMTACVYRGE